MNYFLSRPNFMRFSRFCSLLVRDNFAKECEDILNVQINVELKACHDYLAMAYHFNRCDVSSPGAFEFFKDASSEERKHAEMLMMYMNKRGGIIKLKQIPEPKSSYDSLKDAFIEALNMEKEVNKSLLTVHSIASQHNDPNMCDFIESNFLQEQVDAIKQLADYIRQIERAENEWGSYIFDRYLINSNMHQNQK